MPRRGRKRKIKLKIRPDTVQSTVSIGLIVLAAVILISFFAPNYSLNRKVQKFVMGLFGYPSILLPFIMVIGGLIYSRAVKWKFIELRVLFGLSGLLIGLSSLFSLINLKGGDIGEFIADKTSGALSSVGAFIVFIAISAVSAIFTMDWTFGEVVEKSKGALGKIPVGAFAKFKKEKGEKGEEKEEGKDDMEIVSGADMINDSWASGGKKEEKEEVLDPSFEVVPSMSEPQTGAKAKMGAVDGKEVGTIAQGLPYSDRVWEAPPLDLLSDSPTAPVDRGDVKGRAQIIVDTLKSFGIKVAIGPINFGPAVTQYTLKAATGTPIAKISNRQYDIALALASPTGSVRIEAPIPGTSLIGIEVPNNTRVNVHFKDILTSDAMKSMKTKRGIALGRDVGGVALTYDVGKMPHLLVAGATGSGKSVFLHSLMFSLLYRCSPAECKFILIDPKRVELVHYAGIPHLLAPVITDIDKASSVFKWAVKEMERRYKLLESAKVRNIDGYNEKSGFQALPYIMIVVDELAEIMVADPALVEKSIIRLAQLARAVGIHLVLTVQRPSTNVITGLIKANIPCRVAFNVTSQVDSRVIIDQPGAEKLLGKGDMLFVPPDAAKPIRIQGAFVSEKEISSVVNYLKSVGVTPDYKEEEIFAAATSDTRSVSAGGTATDAKFDEAVETVVTAGKASASLLQRRLSIGYARAARILDELESEGIIGPARGSKPREVLKKMEQSPLDGEVMEETPQAF